MIEIKPHNIVCAGYIGTTLSLDTVHQIEGTEYEPEQFPAARFRINRTTVMVFSSGKMVAVGAPTAEIAFGAMDTMIETLKKHDIPVGNVTRYICNVVATSKFSQGIDLSQVVRFIPRTIYEPEHFSGVIIRWRKPDCTMLLFATGNVVCVGANSINAVSEAVNQLHGKLVDIGVME